MRAWKEGAGSSDRVVRELKDRVAFLEEKLRKAGLSAW